MSEILKHWERHADSKRCYEICNSSSSSRQTDTVPRSSIASHSSFVGRAVQSHSKLNHPRGVEIRKRKESGNANKEEEAATAEEDPHDI